MTELLLAPLLLFAAFVAAIGTIFCLIKATQMMRSNEGFLPYLFYTSIFVNMLQIMSEGRNMFVYDELSDYQQIVYPGYFLAIARLNSALILLAAFLRVTSRLTQYRSMPDTPTLLIGAFLFFFFTNVVTPAFLSAHPSVEHYYVYLALVGTASLLFIQGEEAISIRAARNAFFLFLVISAGFIPAKPEVVIDSNYVGGLIPGFTYRYAGLAPHANHLGQIATLFLLCLWSKPYSSRWINFWGWTLGYASLAFAQSKTSWISCIICMSCMGYFKYGDDLKQRLFNMRNPVFTATLIVMTMAMAGGILGMVLFSNVGNKLSLFFSTRAGADLMTMTGRIRIWDAAINEWRSSPLFGYGLTIWNDAHRARLGLPMAFHAHNQFYQTLSSAGVVGVMGLIVYVTTLVRFTLKTARSSQGLTLAILLMLFFQSISEVPLAISGHFDFDAITHLLLLMIIGAQFKPYNIKKTTEMPAKTLIFSRGLN